MSSKDISFAPPRGMRDFYPEDMAVRSSLFDSWRESAARYGFSQYDACVVESMELLRRKAGEEIAEQIYTFRDKSNRELALRPEMTPSLARMIVARQGSLSFPLKWFSLAQCFRYERTTRGRKREHYQWNLDIVGDPDVASEAEVIACAADSMTSLGIAPSAFRVKFNNRRLLSDLLASFSIPDEQHGSVFLALDKKGKIPDDKINDILVENGVPQDTLAKITEMTAMKSLEDVAAVIPESSALAESQAFVKAAEAFGISGLLDFDITVIRGLAYYTGIVFEAFDKDRKLRAIFGGGRYDNLLSSIGGKEMTAVGLGFGDVVITELMGELGCSIAKTQDDGLLIGFMQEEQRLMAAKAATHFRRQGKQVSLISKPQKPKAFFKTAGDGSYSSGIYVGPDDIEAGVLKIKNLASREQTPLSIAQLQG